MYDENTFAAAYRSDLRDKIVETLEFGNAVSELLAE